MANSFCKKMSLVPVLPRGLLFWLILLNCCATLYGSQANAQELLPMMEDEKWGYVNEKGRQKIKPRYDYAQFFSEGLAWVRRNERWELINHRGKTQQKYEIDVAHPFSGGFAKVEYRGKVGLVNREGQLVLPIQFQKIQRISYRIFAVQSNDLTTLFDHLIRSFDPRVYQAVQSPQEGLVPVKHEGKWGYLDTLGAQAIPYRYQQVLPFSEGRAWVREAGLWGIINTKGEWVSSPQYDRVFDGFRNGFSEVVVGPFQGIVDREGYIILPPEYLGVGEYAQGLVWFDAGAGVGFADTTGRVAIEPRFQAAGQFSGNRAPVLMNNRYGYINTLGQVVVSPRFEAVGGFRHGRAPVRLNDQWGLIDTMGAWVAQPAFSEITPFADSLWRVKNALNRQGLLTNQGDTLLPMEYMEIRMLEDKIQTLASLPRYGYLTPTGKRVTTDYDYLSPGQSRFWVALDSAGKATYLNRRAQVVQHYNGLLSAEGNYSWAASEGKLDWNAFERRHYQLNAEIFRNPEWQVIDSTGHFASVARYKRVAPFERGLARVRMNDLWGVVDSAGRLTIEPQFDFLTEDFHGRRIARIDSLYGLINQRGDFLVEPRYNFIFPVRSNLFEVGIIKEDLYGERHSFSELVNREGKPVFTRYYELLQPFREGLAGIKLDGKWGYLNEEGGLHISPVFSEARPFSNGLAAVEANGFWGLIDTGGNFVLQPTYDAIAEFSEGLVAVKKADKWGYITPDGKVKIDFLFQAAGAFQQGLAPVKIMGRWGLIDTGGIIRLEPQYHHLERLPSGYYRSSLVRPGDFRASRGRADVVPRIYGMVSPEGEVVLEPSVTYIWDFANGKAVFKAFNTYPDIEYRKLSGELIYATEPEE